MDQSENDSGNKKSALIKSNEQRLAKPSTSLIDRGLDLSAGLSINANPFENIEEAFRLNSLPEMVNLLEFSPSGEYLVSVSKDKKIRLWDTRSGNLHHVFEGHKDKISCLDISQSQTYMVSSDWSGQTIIWDLVSKALRKRLFNPTKNTIKINQPETIGLKISVDEKSITSINIFDRILLHSFPVFELRLENVGFFESVVNTPCFSIDGRNVLSVGLGGRLFFWDISTNSKRIVSPMDGFLAEPIISLSADGKHALFIWSEEPVIDLISTSSQESLFRVHLYSQDHLYEQPSSKPQSKNVGYYQYARGDLGSLVALTTEEPKSQNTKHFSDFKLNSLNISSDAKLCVAGSSFEDLVLISFGGDLKAFVYHVFNTSVINTAFSSKKRLIAANSVNNEVIVWSF